MVRTYKEYARKFPKPILKIIRFVFLYLKKIITDTANYLLFRVFYAFPNFTNICGKRVLKLEFRNLLNKKQIFENDSIEILLRLPVHTYSVGPYFFDDIKPKEINSVVDQLLLKVKGAVICGSSSVVSVGEKTAIYDLYVLQNKKNYKYTDRCIKYIRGDCIVRQYKDFSHCKKGILLSGNYSWNYYHLTIDILPKLYYVNKLGIDSDVPLIIDEVCMKVNNYRELVEIFNVKNRKIIVVESGEQYAFEELFLPFQPNFCPPNFYQADSINLEDFYYDYNSLNFVRNIMLGKKSHKKFPKKIFISRSKASKRREFNEDEIFNELKKYGFVRICPENYSVRDQVAMFNGASWIAGGGGAAFTNLLYTNSNCRVMCFTNYNFSMPIFSSLASVSGADVVFFYDYLKAVTGKCCLHDSYNIDCKLVVDFLNKMSNKLFFE